MADVDIPDVTCIPGLPPERRARAILLERARAVERELWMLRNAALTIPVSLEQRDRLRLAHDTLTYFILEEASHG